ncbi:hypothetical protein K431DRAFT_334720, partial [Polychaeton citri CBS 116435]
WDLLKPHRLLTQNKIDSQQLESHHLAQAFAIHGIPPLDLLQRSEKCNRSGDEEGKHLLDVQAAD